MPILKTAKINDKSAYAIWEITECVEELGVLVENATNVQLPDRDISNETKQSEWMAGRLLLASLVEEMELVYYGIYKDDYGKPHLKNLDYHISLSHSFPLVAAIIHQNHSVGIDVEQPKEKLLRIASRFLSEEEQEVCGNNTEMLCIHWCAKEALYKLYGKKQLIFKENLLIRMAGDQLSGKVIVNGVVSEYKLQVEKVMNSFLVFTL